MPENKTESERYYWLKLKRDFFKRHDIKVIEGMENGKDYVLFYLKLLCESIDHDGNLRFSDTIPYSENMLASVTGTNIDVVRSAMKILISLDLVEILDDQTIFMREVDKMTGSESKWAEIKRLQRAVQGQCPNDVQRLSSNVQQEYRDKSKNYNTHTARAREREQFFSDFAISDDGGVSGDWDWTALKKAYQKSQKLLQCTPAAKCTSWIAQHYKSILAGKYEDRADKSDVKNKVVERYSADELNAMFTHYTDDDEDEE